MPDNVAWRTGMDEDADGLDDGVEDRLAERFAPIIQHGEHETTFPIDVDSWLARTHLSALDEAAGRVQIERVVEGPLKQHQLLNHTVQVRGVEMSSSGTRSRMKRASFFLDDVPKAERPQGIRPSEWVTYVHSYPNELGGMTIQYWRAYMWNDASFLGMDVSHGGDWEAVSVYLDRQMKAYKVAFLDHTGIIDGTAAVQWEGTHPLVWSEEGGHSSTPNRGRSRSSRWIRHPTWTGGVVTRWDGAALGVSGGLKNVGEKLHPRHGQMFIQFSGLWGSPGRLFMTSGYWGPAFNETGALCADREPAYDTYLRPRARAPKCAPLFMTAWCDEISPPFDESLECHPHGDSY